MFYLAGDLGGTKTLLAVYSVKEHVQNIHQKRYVSADWKSFAEILNDFLENLPSTIESPTKGCVCIAGPVKQGKSKITNLGWDLDKKKLIDQTSLEELDLINDFSVLIYGLYHFSSEQYVEVQNRLKPLEIDEVVTIIGAGTGLGIARGINTKSGLIALPSEGGHREFSPRCNKEVNLYEWIKKDLNLSRVSLERIVSGTGLGQIARWRLQKEDAHTHPLNLKDIANNFSITSLKDPNLPSVVSKLAEEGDPLMIEVLKMWLSAYGSAVGDLALHELSTGGIWIAGGTAAKQIKGIQSKIFISAMTNKGRFEEFMKELQVIALTDPEAGLFSSACRALMLK